MCMHVWTSVLFGTAQSYACMHVYTSQNSCLCICECTCVFMHACMHVCIIARPHDKLVQKHFCMHAQACIHVRISAHPQGQGWSLSRCLPTWACQKSYGQCIILFVYMYVCMYVCMYVSMHAGKLLIVVFPPMHAVRQREAILWNQDNAPSDALCMCTYTYTRVCMCMMALTQMALQRPCLRWTQERSRPSLYVCVYIYVCKKL